MRRPSPKPETRAAGSPAPRNPYLFVIGCLRSGTTLLQRMLDSHPRLAVGYDCHFIPQAIRRVPVGVDPPVTPDLVERVRSSPRFARLGLPADAPDRAARASATYSEFVTAVYDEFGRLHGKPLSGEKAPGYCRHIPRLDALFPWSRFVHIIRDGRDIALSVVDWGKGPARLELAHVEPVAATALWWRRDVLAGREGGQGLGPERYCEVRYETLVADPRAELSRLARFLDLPFADEMLTFHEGKTDDRPGKSAKAAWLPPTQGLRDWRTQMSPRDVALFETLAGDVLASLGLDLASHGPSREIEAVAERCRRWWRENMEEEGEDGDDRPAPVIRTGEGARRSANPAVFIVGCPRSGTTLLKRMVDAHPRLAITPETHWVPRHYRKRQGVDASGLVTPELIPALLAYRKFANLGIGRPELERLVEGPGPVTYARFVSGVFDLFAAHAGKPLAGDKTPGYVQEIPLLHELWPAARFVHLIRDGRDVCLSMLEWDRAYRTAGRFGTWAEDPVATTALWWERFVRLGREAGRTLGPDLYLEVSYESLVTQPREQCAALCRFLDLPDDESMVSFHEGRTKPDPTLSAKKGWKPVTPGMRDWRSQMRAGDLERFEAVAGELLDELGYERGVPRPGPEALRRASAIRERFTGDPRVQNRRLPDRWQPAAV